MSGSNWSDHAMFSPPPWTATDYTQCYNMLAFLHEASVFGSLRKPRLASTFPSPFHPTRCSNHTLRSLRIAAHQSNNVNIISDQPSPVPSLSKHHQAGLGVVILKRGKARLFRELRNPMVYAGAVEKHIPLPNTKIRDCDPVAVWDGENVCVGYGFFNAHSMFRVRLLRHVDAASPTPLPWDFAQDIYGRLRDAVALRERLGLPGADTDVFRVVNGEGDRLSGLVVDRVGDTLVVASSAMWCERYAGEILDGLQKVLPGCEDVVWRPNIERLRQDGLQEEDGLDAEEKVQASEGESPSPERRAASEEDADAAFVMREAGVKYSVSRFALTKGQKTGHYADQRENRVHIRELVRQSGRITRVLDLFCYTGGFALNAALGDAKTCVTAVDSSARAVATGRTNAVLNGVADRVEFVQMDVSKYLRGAGEDEEGYDMVILDPPKFAPSVKGLERAVIKYRRLNLSAMRMVRKGGLLVSCSCSAPMTQEKGRFLDMVRRAGAELGREVQLLRMFGAGADHPITPEVPETEYLTVCVFACR